MEIDLVRIGRTQGALVSLGPSLAFGTYGLAHATPLAGSPILTTVFWAAGSLAVTAAGALFTWYPRLARILGTAGICAVLAVLLSVLLESPPLMLLALVSATTLIDAMWNSRQVSFRSERGRMVFQRTITIHALRSICLVGIGSWFSMLAFQLASSPVASLATTVLSMITIGTAWKWTFLERRLRTKRSLGLGLASILLTVATVLLWHKPEALITATIWLPVLLLILVRDHREETFAGVVMELILEHPARLLMLTFLFLSMVGAMILYLPESASSGHSIGFVNAAFTAISAVCVTGLTVLDTGKDFTLFGQIVILALIQVGALGIMTFYTAAFGLLGRRFSVRHERALSSMMAGEHMGELSRSIWKILGLTLFVEAVGTLLLTAQFHLAGEPMKSAIWRGLFTSISAFCNAGFALQTESLATYATQAGVLHTIAALIIIGGISPVAVASLPAVFARRQVGLHVKIVFWSTAVLLLVGTIGFLTFEWSHTLSNLSVADRLTNAWFQSVTTRTAGFNSVDLASTRPATLVLIMALMFIGGSPGGTAGGIKTTTFFLILLPVVAAFRGASKVVIFGRMVPHASIYRSAAVISSSVFVLLLTAFALLLTQDLPAGQALFEAVSALGTVGLSIGATGKLDQVGKIIIMICMFSGRVGPLTVFMFLSGRQRQRQDWKVPEEEVTVG